MRSTLFAFAVLLWFTPPLAAQDAATTHPVAVTYYRVFDGHHDEYATILAERGRPVYDKLAEMGVILRSTVFWQDDVNADWHLVSLVEWESVEAMEAGSGSRIAEAVEAVFPGMTTEEWFAFFTPHREMVRQEVWTTGP